MTTPTTPTTPSTSSQASIDAPRCVLCGQPLPAGPYAATLRRCDDCAPTPPEPCDICTTRPALRRYPAGPDDHRSAALAADASPTTGIGPYLAVCGRCDRTGGAR